MTYIVDILTPYQEESFLRWAKEAAVKVKSKATPRKRKPIKPVVLDNDDEYVPATREEILESLRQGMHDIKLHQAGKLKLKTIEEVLYELQHSSVAVL
jgi:hypothetical protein